MGMWPENKKRKASHDLLRDARSPKSARVTSDDIQFESSPSLMVIVTTAPPPKRDGDEPEVVDIRVVGTYTHADQAQSTLLHTLNTNNKRIASHTRIKASPQAGGHPLAAQDPDTIHYSHNDVTGALCIVQHVVPTPANHGAQADVGWLRIGEIIPKEAARIQRLVMSNSVYVILGSEGDHYDSPMPQEGAETVAVYRSQHEANRHVLSEFARHSGAHKLRTRSVRGRQDDSNDGDAIMRDGNAGQPNMLCFINGCAKVRVTGELAVMTWEVVQKVYL